MSISRRWRNDNERWRATVRGVGQGVPYHTGLEAQWTHACMHSDTGAVEGLCVMLQLECVD